jgi:hypothetical protein
VRYIDRCFCAGLCEQRSDTEDADLAPPLQLSRVTPLENEIEFRRFVVSVLAQNSDLFEIWNFQISRFDHLSKT